MTPIFTLESHALPEGVVVAALRGRDALSEPYRFAVGLLVPDDDAFDMDAAVGAEARLTIEGESGPLAFQGVLASVAHLHALDGHALYQAVLVPRLDTLAQSLHSQVFVDMTVPDVVRAVLDGEGIGAADVRFDLSERYPSEPHVCQYHEDNLAFVSRLLEREGIYYHFEEIDGAERLVITDRSPAEAPLRRAPVRVRPGSQSEGMAGEALFAFRCKSRIAPGAVTLRDYDYERPDLDVSGRAKAWSRGSGEVHVHGASFTRPADGARLARVLAEEIRCGQKRYHGHGRVSQLRAGSTFEVVEHPRAAFNRRYRVVAVEHHGVSALADATMREALGLEHEETYRVDVVAIESHVPYRPERRTPRPRIYGVENGVIDGAGDSAYAQIDAQGRYKVKIDFDEADATGAQASTWVRMMQPHGGSNEGFHFPLRKGTEVLLTFLGGDPDRPVISGVLPNAHTPSPVTAQNRTANVIQSGGRNRLEMEDLDGKQRTELSTPTEQTYLNMGAPRGDGGFNVELSTAGDARHFTGKKREVEVGADDHESVAGHVTIEHAKNQSVTIGKDQEVVVRGDASSDVGGDHQTTVSGAQTTTVSGDVSKRYESGFYRHVGTASFVEDIDSTGSVHVATTETWMQEVGGKTAGRKPQKTYHLDVQGDGKMKFDKGFRIEGGSACYVDLDADGVWLEQTNSYKKFSSYSSEEHRGGQSFNSYLGSLEEFFLGVKLDVSAAGSVSISTGVALEVDMGIHFQFAYFPTFAIAPMKEDTIPIFKSRKNIEWEDAAMCVKNLGAALLGGFHIFK